MTTLLAGDIGGTKTMLALYGSAGQELEVLAEERYSSADWGDLVPMVRHFLAAAGPSLPAGAHRPSAACFAVAGPVQGGRARLTNLPWLLDQAALAEAIGIDGGRVELVNDFAVLVHGLPHLKGRQQAPVRPGSAMANEPLLIIGAGTGLGVTLGIPTASGLQAMASEAAHAEFAPRDQREWELKQWLREDLGLERVSIERVVSGSGLAHVARWLLAERDPQGCHPLRAASEPAASEQAASGQAEADQAPADLAAAVSAAAGRGDPLAIDALELWLAAYGSVVGDLALACLSRGGIWLAGGTAGKQLEQLRGPVFERAFLAKGRLRPVLETMPIQALIDPQVGCYSAACRARTLLQRTR